MNMTNPVDEYFSNTAEMVISGINSQTDLVDKRNPYLYD